MQSHRKKGTSSIIDVYYPEQDRWIEQIEMPEERSWHSSSVSQNKVYVIGGTHFWDGWLWKDIQDSLAIVEEYTPRESFFVAPKDELSSTWGNIKFGYSSK